MELETKSLVMNNQEDVKEHERVISLKVIDKLVEKSGESLESFIDKLKEFANKENIVTFSVLCREYNNSKRVVGSGAVEKVDRKDYIKSIIKDLLEHESSIIKGKVIKINRSRKPEAITTYNVKIEQALGEALVKIQINSMDKINILSGNLLIQSVSAAKHPQYAEAVEQLNRQLEEEANSETVVDTEPEAEMDDSIVIHDVDASIFDDDAPFDEEE